MVGMVEVHMDIPAMNAALEAPLTRMLLSRALRVQTLAKRRVPVDQGVLRNSIMIGPISHFGGYPQITVGTNNSYAMFVHRGTGMYGPYQTPIVPKHSTVMVFTAKDGTIVFSKSVVGQPGVPYLAEALKEAFLQ